MSKEVNGKQTSVVGYHLGLAHAKWRARWSDRLSHVLFIEHIKQVLSCLAFLDRFLDSISSSVPGIALFPTHLGAFCEV